MVSILMTFYPGFPLFLGVNTIYFLFFCYQQLKELAFSRLCSRLFNFPTISLSTPFLRFKGNQTIDQEKNCVILTIITTPNWSSFCIFHLRNGITSSQLFHPETVILLCHLALSPPSSPIHHQILNISKDTFSLFFQHKHLNKPLSLVSSDC